MKEDFLHFLWESGKVSPSGLTCSRGESLRIADRGELNTNAGPDFLNALVEVNDTLWAGHVEMHLRSSAWYEHGHHRDIHYNNVVLHVVWEHDREVYLSDGSRLPVLELKGKVSEKYLHNYRKLSAVHHDVVNCARMHRDFSASQWEGWLELLFLRRQEGRFRDMLKLDPALRTHWEELLFRAVFRYAGARVNADSFYSIAAAVGIGKVRKIVAAGESLELVFHGMAGFFENGEEGVPKQRKKEYNYLKRKYALNTTGVIRPVFFRLRPHSFPTLRLSQLATLFTAATSLFSAIRACDTLEELRGLFTVAADEFWDNRYTYKTASSSIKPKILSTERIDLILLNAVFPVLYGYYRNRGSADGLKLPGLASRMPAESNKILRALKSTGFPVSQARDGQAVLELYTNYCAKNRCLNCRIGKFIIGG